MRRRRRSNPDIRSAVLRAIKAGADTLDAIAKRLGGVAEKPAVKRELVALTKEGVLSEERRKGPSEAELNRGRRRSPNRYAIVFDDLRPQVKRRGIFSGSNKTIAGAFRDLRDQQADTLEEGHAAVFGNYRVVDAWNAKENGLGDYPDAPSVERPTVMRGKRKGAPKPTRRRRKNPAMSARSSVAPAITETRVREIIVETITAHAAKKITARNFSRPKKKRTK